MNVSEGNKSRRDPRFLSRLDGWRKTYKPKEERKLGKISKPENVKQLPIEDAEESLPKVQSFEQSTRKSKDINDVIPEEAELYLRVPGWRIWERSIFDAFVDDLDQQEKALLTAAEKAESKELTLISKQYDKGYSYIWYKLEDIEMALHPKRPRLPVGPGSMVTDMPWYVLEPLTADEVKTIDESDEIPGPGGRIDRSIELLRPGELQEILAEPGRRITY